MAVGLRLFDRLRPFVRPGDAVGHSAGVHQRPCRVRRRQYAGEGIHFRNVMCRAVFRRDGFIGVEADYTGGELTTPPL